MDLPNIVLVVFDTARRDRFGCYGYQRLTTPTVDSLASEGLVLDTMITNGPWTLPSHGSLFTGLYPAQHGSQWRSGLSVRDSVPLTVAEFLGGLGYDTWCVTNNVLITEATRLTRGFGHTIPRRDIESKGKRILRHAKRVAVGGDSGGGVVNAWIRHALPPPGRPLFLFVNYAEPHWPWAPPNALVRRTGGLDRPGWSGLRYRVAALTGRGAWDVVPSAGPDRLRVLSALYDGEMANVDRHLDVLLGALRDRGHLRHPTLVMVTSDHGEHLGEHGLADHFAALDDVLIRVPFIAWGPGIIQPSRVRGTFEFVDVLPALARLLGQAVPDHLSGRRDGLFEGRPDERDVAFAEWRSWTPEGLANLSRRNPHFRFDGINRDLVCARDGRFKLVRTGDGSETLFDLLEDPSESRDVRDAFPSEATRLGAELDGEIRSWKAWEATTDVSERERQDIEHRLAELGYI